MSMHGARYLHVLVPCPLGWGSASRRHRPAGPAGHAERAVPGVRGRARRGHRRHADPAPVPGRGVPARCRAATPTCSASTPRPDVVATHPGAADRNIARYGLLDDEQETDMDKPFAITLDVGSSRANHTGTWRTERPVYVDRLPPCSNACPAGEDVRGWLYDAEDGEAGYEKAWRTIMETNPFPAVMGRVCYHPCETACNRGQLDERGRHQLGRAVPRRRGDRAGWTVSVDAEPTGQRVLVVGAGPGRTVGGVPPRAARPRGHRPGRRAAGRRDDALRHPALPAAP